MIMEALRFQVVGEAFKKKALDVKTPSERPAKYFGKKVFNREKMYKYLPKDVYEKMIDVMDNGARLDRQVADAVAEGMKQWATEKCFPSVRRRSDPPPAQQPACPLPAGQRRSAPRPYPPR